eukprot:2963163-Rhodomonas_salina.1
MKGQPSPSEVSTHQAASRHQTSCINASAIMHQCISRHASKHQPSLITHQAAISHHASREGGTRSISTARILGYKSSSGACQARQ